jgi:hypothetical protein
MTAESTSAYVAWLESTGQPVFRAGIAWRRYGGAIVPADPTLTFVDVEPARVGDLPGRAAAYCARWSGRPTRDPTEWWHVVSDQFDRAELSSNVRNQIKRGFHANDVRPIQTEWLAAHGYNCYLESFSRYKGARPVSATEFEREIRLRADAPIEAWGVFAGEELAGYALMIVEDQRGATSAIKYKPSALREYASYALTATLLDEYVGNRHLALTNGSRPVLHKTEMQEFLLKFGFERRYGALEIVYSPRGRAMAAASKWVAPAAHLLPGAVGAKVRALAFQERIRRATVAHSADE